MPARPNAPPHSPLAALERTLRLEHPIYYANDDHRTPCSITLRGFPRDEAVATCVPSVGHRPNGSLVHARSRRSSGMCRRPQRARVTIIAATATTALAVAAAAAAAVVAASPPRAIRNQ